MAIEDRPRRSISVTNEQREMWADLDALAAERGCSLSVLVNDAIAEYPLLRAYRAGKAAGAELASIAVSA